MQTKTNRYKILWNEFIITIVSFIQGTSKVLLTHRSPLYIAGIVIPTNWIKGNNQSLTAYLICFFFSSLLVILIEHKYKIIFKVKKLLRIILNHLKEYIVICNIIFSGLTQQYKESGPNESNLWNNKVNNRCTMLNNMKNEAK